MYYLENCGPFLCDNNNSFYSLTTLFYVDYMLMMMTVKPLFIQFSEVIG